MQFVFIFGEVIISMTSGKRYKYVISVITMKLLNKQKKNWKHLSFMFFLQDTMILSG